MSITVNTKAYNLDATVDVNHNQYTGPDHNVSVKDVLSLRRSRSASTATRLGTAKAFAKFTRTLTVDGQKYDAIIEGSISIPVGAAKADVDSLRDDLGDLLISSNGDDLMWKHDINQ